MMAGFSETGQATQEVARDAFRFAASYTPGGEFSISISANEVEVAKSVGVGIGIGIGIGAVAIGTLYTYSRFRPLIDDAVRRAFGGERRDQGDPDIGTGSLIVRLRCFTDERFLELLEDYEHGRLKDCLEKEFYKIGFRVKEMNVKILNIEEVNKTKEAILARYV